MWMVSPKQKATAPMPQNTPLDELVVDAVVEDDKLKIFLDLYFWFSGHLVKLNVPVGEYLRLCETPVSNYEQRVRWTCVSLSKTQLLLFGERLIEPSGLRLPLG